MKSFVTMNSQTITGILLQYINFGTFVFSFLCQTLSKICAWVFVYALLGCSFPYFLYSHLLQLSFFFFFFQFLQLILLLHTLDIPPPRY